MSKKRSAAQQAALNKYIYAKQMFKDFSAAQGYAACYAERVEPLVKMLTKLVVHKDIPQELLTEATELLKENPVD